MDIASSWANRPTTAVRCVGAGFQFFVSVTHLGRRGVAYAMAGGATHSRQLRMPRAASGNFAFEVEQISAMHRAFEAVCAGLQLSVGLEIA